MLLGTCIKELHLPTWPAPPLTALAVWASTHTCTGGAHHTRAMGDDGTCQARRARPPGAPCICCCQPPTPTAHPGPPCENPGTRPHCQPRAADCTEPALGWSPHAQRPSAVPSHQPRHALPIQQGEGAITWAEARGRRARAASCRAAAGAWPAAALTTPHKSAGSLAQQPAHTPAQPPFFGVWPHMHPRRHLQQTMLLLPSLPLLGPCSFRGAPGVNNTQPTDHVW